MNWLKKISNAGWLAVCVAMALLCAFSYYLEKKEYAPSRLAAYIQKDFSQKEAAIDSDRESGEFQKCFRDYKVQSPPKSYFLFLVKGENTLFWNTTIVDLPREIVTRPDSFAQGGVIDFANGFYYVRSYYEGRSMDMTDTAKKYIFTLIPIKYIYKIENEYFASHFPANKRIPSSTIVTSEPEPGAIPILKKNKRPAFYLVFEETADDMYIASPIIWILAIISIMSLVFWIDKVCHRIGTRTGKPARGWYVLILAVLLLGTVWRLINLPAGFTNSKLFSPELLSSGETIRSLGDFIVEVLLCLWVFIYLVAYVPFAGKIITGNSLADKLIRVGLAGLLIPFLYLEVAEGMYLLVIDSKISFEVSDFSSLTAYTFVGIAVLSILTVIFLLVLDVINDLLNRIIRKLVVKYIFVIIAHAFFIYFLSTTEVRVFYVAIAFMSVAGMLVIDAWGLPFKRKSTQYDFSVPLTLYLWFALLCSWITLEIFYFNYSKEKELRKIFAQKQALPDEGQVAYAFLENFTPALQEDTVVQQFLEHPLPELYNTINQYIFCNHLIRKRTKKYRIEVYYYDTARRPLFNHAMGEWFLRLADSISNHKFDMGALSIEKEAGDGHLFWLFSPIYKARDDIDSTLIGYIGLDISIDRRPRIMNQRSFIDKKNNPTDQQYFNEYAFAVYRNNTLWFQSGNNIFPYVNTDTTGKKDYLFKDESLHSSMLLYHPTKEELIKVIYNRNLLTNIISLFSYVLAVLLVLTGVTIGLRQVLFYPRKTRTYLRNINFTIRSKINITILLTVFISLLTVGIITLSFLNSKYKQNQRKSLHNLLLYYTQNINHFFEENKLDPGTLDDNNALFRHSELSYKLSTLSDEQGTDINLYDKNGQLFATSQWELMKNHLLSTHMQRDVLTVLRRGDPSELLKEEKMGSLTYQSIYTPLRNKDDEIIAYVNLPYYASGEELNDEISNVLVALINVYTLIFFLSGISAVFISSGIIRSFRLLIDQFRNIRLRHNEYIEWPYKDEIGVLVKEYNVMMRKVETMASKLAHTEREAAWREIARQVAHEIKNPLTPMKLNIQYLQQAIKSGRQDIDTLALKVSVTLIEQIEHLSLIASEFSNFAKMPEANPEIMNLRQSLQSLIALFQKDNKVSVELIDGNPDLFISMDKSYFIRIFTNLIQNAIQAIDEDKDGLVQVRYQKKEDNVLIEIKDNGSGIPEELQEKLFVPYFTTKSSGTGLGLPMTKNMIEYFNGSIWFETTLNEGSTFYVQLPLAEEIER